MLKAGKTVKFGLFSVLIVISGAMVYTGAYFMLKLNFEFSREDNEMSNVLLK